MKLARIKSIKVFTDGTIYFSHKSLQSTKQIVFYEKDYKTSLFSKKIKKKQVFPNQQKNFYKLKYTF